MKVVFMGTPEFAQRPLAELCSSDHQISAIVTGCDKQSGRGRKLLPTPCRQEAEKHGIPVLTPGSLRSKKLYASLDALGADIFIVCAFRILPRSLFDLPRLGSINIHTSLLPKYRGAAPINRALINGDTETGLSSFFLNDSVDTGDLIDQMKISIRPDDNFDSLHDRMSAQAGQFLLKTLDMIESGNYQPIPQDESKVSLAPKLEPADGLIDFDQPAATVVNFVRGMSTRPGAYTCFRGKKLKIYACIVHPEENPAPAKPGEIVGIKKRLLVSCKDSIIELLQVLPEGKKVMDGVSFINGQRLQAGEVLEELAQGSKEKI